MPHIHEKYDFVVDAIITYKDKVLLVDHPRYGYWLPIGGHVELDEDPEEALIREVKEEAGLDIEVLGDKPSIHTARSKFIYAPRYINVHDANPPHKHIGLIYFVKANTDKVTKSDEHKQIKWFSIDDLDDPKYKILEEVKFYAREALTSIKTT